MMKTIIIFVVVTLTVTYSQGKYVDLTHAISKDMVLWPGRKISFNIEHEGPMPNGDWLASRGFSISEHTGTHMDAPYHFFKEGGTLDTIPIEKFIDVPGICVDISDKVHLVENGKLKTIENYVLTRQDLIEWEEKNGPIPPQSLVLLRTGWGKKWNNRADYLGIKPEDSKAESNANSTIELNQKMNFPGFDASAALFLTNERNVYGVGLDCMSIDAGTSSDFPAHKIFSARGIYMLENVANLEAVPTKNFRLFAVPLKLSGTGSPIRLLAKLPDN